MELLDKEFLCIYHEWGTMTDTRDLNDKQKTDTPHFV